jgi:cullin-associated NEDD8-dissociated protein 1
VLNAQSLHPVLVELPPLLSDSDLHIAQLTMNLLSSVARLRPDALPVVTTASLPEVYRLAQSPLLQGAALTAMLDLYQALVASNSPDLSQRRLIEALVNPVLATEGATIHKQVFLSHESSNSRV